jgi:hypothetical protein
MLTLNFVKASKSCSSFPDDPPAIWQKLADQFGIDTTPGDQSEIVMTRYQVLASILSRRLAAAFSGE